MRGRLSRTVFAAAQLLRFGGLQLVSCLFPAALFAGLAVSKYADLPIARYDALLVFCLLLTFGFWLVRLETWREIAVIFGFHLRVSGYRQCEVLGGQALPPRHPRHSRNPEGD